MNDAIHSRIADMFFNILKQVMEKLAATQFFISLQLVAQGKGKELSHRPCGPYLER